MYSGGGKMKVYIILVSEYSCDTGDGFDGYTNTQILNVYSSENMAIQEIDRLKKEYLLQKNKKELGEYDDLYELQEFELIEENRHIIERGKE